MTSPRIFITFAVLMVFAGIACAAQPEGMHSFADLYRLTVGTEYGAQQGIEPGASEAPQRAASRVPVSFAVTDDAGSESASAGASSPPSAGSREGPYVFSTGALPRPGRWLLLLSGLALAAWVARRRLGYSL